MNLDQTRLAKRALAALCLALATGCGGGEPLKVCGQIPDGGCPIGRGGTCDDVYCAGLYDCVDGQWRQLEVCEQGQGGGASTSSSSVSSSSGCQMAQFDHTGELQNCTPDLEMPDCPVTAAETCGPCLTGCVDFFMCKSIGWTNVAYCDEETGELILVTR